MWTLEVQDHMCTKIPPTIPHPDPPWTPHPNLRRNGSQHLQGCHLKVQTTVEISSNWLILICTECVRSNRGYMHLPLATNNCVLNVLQYDKWQITVYLDHRVNAPLISAGSITTFSGEANLCPRCNKKVYFGMFLSVLITFHTRVLLYSWILVIGNS